VLEAASLVRDQVDGATNSAVFAGRGWLSALLLLGRSLGRSAACGVSRRGW
jgi:hypothetical protein